MVKIRVERIMVKLKTKTEKNHQINLFPPKNFQNGGAFESYMQKNNKRMPENCCQISKNDQMKKPHLKTNQNRLTHHNFLIL